MVLGIIMLTLLVGAAIVGTFNNRNGDVFFLGGSTFACKARFESYNGAMWKELPSLAARNGKRCGAFGIRDGKAFAVAVTSEKARWIYVVYIPLPN